MKILTQLKSYYSKMSWDLNTTGLSNKWEFKLLVFVKLLWIRHYKPNIRFRASYCILLSVTLEMKYFSFLLEILKPDRKLEMKIIFLSNSYLFHALIIIKEHIVPEGETHQSKAKKVSVRTNDKSGTSVHPVAAHSKAPCFTYFCINSLSLSLSTCF